jgi:O-antigen/teichoic acid export membrane protein
MSRSAATLVGRAWLRIDARTRHAAAAGAFGVLGRLGGALVVLVYAPMAREALGLERFGVWMMLTAWTTLFAFADLGVGNAALNRVTAALAADGDAARRRQQLGATVDAAVACTIGLGLLLLVLAAAWAWLVPVPSIVAGPITPGNRAEVDTALALFAVIFALSLPAALGQKLQLGAQDGHWAGWTQLVASVLSLAALPLVLQRGGGLPELVLATQGVSLLVQATSALWWLRRRGLPLPRPLRAWRTPALLKGLLVEGTAFFGLQLAAAAAFQSDALIVTQRLGAEVYGDYAVVQRIYLLVGAGVVTALAGLWPAFGDAWLRRDIAWVRRTLWRAVLAAGLSTLAAVLLLQLLLPGWAVNPLGALAPPAPLLLALLGAWTVVEALGAVCAALMNGANLIRIQVVLALVMAMLAVAGKWWTTPLLGPAGAVLSTLLAYLLISVPGQVFLIRRLLATPAKPTT